MTAMYDDTHPYALSDQDRDIIKQVKSLTYNKPSRTHIYTSRELFDKLVEILGRIPDYDEEYGSPIKTNQRIALQSLMQEGIEHILFNGCILIPKETVHEEKEK